MIAGEPGGEGRPEGGDVVLAVNGERMVYARRSSSRRFRAMADMNIELTVKRGDQSSSFVRRPSSAATAA